MSDRPTADQIADDAAAPLVETAARRREQLERDRAALAAAGPGDDVELLRRRVEVGEHLAAAAGRVAERHRAGYRERAGRVLVAIG